jgi:hypothetical protein
MALDNTASGPVNQWSTLSAHYDPRKCVDVTISGQTASEIPSPIGGDVIGEIDSRRRM